MGGSGSSLVSVGAMLVANRTLVALGGGALAGAFFSLSLSEGPVSVAVVVALGVALSLSGVGGGVG